MKSTERGDPKVFYKFDPPILFIYTNRIFLFEKVKKNY